jgi:hypothetical protein
MPMNGPQVNATPRDSVAGKAGSGQQSTIPYLTSHPWMLMHRHKKPHARLLCLSNGAIVSYAIQTQTHTQQEEVQQLIFFSNLE